VDETRSKKEIKQKREKKLTGPEQMMRKVYWQSFFYLAAFLISYPVWFVGNLLGNISA
jgi:hypothetical protein